MKKVLCVLALPLCVMLAGCPHQTAPPTGATTGTIYQQGAVVMDSIATEAQIAQQGLINLHTSGKVPDAIYQQIQAVFLQVGRYGKQIDALILAQASSKSITDQVNAAIGSLSGIATNVAGLDPQTAAQVNGYVQVAQQLLQQLLPLFLPAKVAGINALPEVTPWIQQPSPNSPSLPKNSSSTASARTRNFTRLPLPTVSTSSRFPTFWLTPTPSSTQS